jgi:hypothetical protein
MSDIVNRLRGIYTVPVNDGAGPLNGSDTFTRTFPVAPIRKEAADEIERLRAAIIKHRSQKADDRCIEDDDALYAALGDGIGCDRRVGDKAAMLQNCARFIERRCEGGGWPTYAELEAEMSRLRAVLDALMEWREADRLATRIESEGRKLSDEGRGAAEAANDKLWKLRFAADELIAEAIRARPSHRGAATTGGE